ncbi:DUF3990 domain-containing protein [Adlercreutzia sp. ZJ141]|uniref:DUF3990 domain-containing protein n=1 Tax=Adlercreutzia sp. ZJ141 TaxID=2709406 RepID=UPI0013EDDD71|nr:DUF3990 domain-containing protein [Adlercreutzia sp. ZJ141]
MRLYHGSDQIVSKPKVDRCRPNLDFGRGFYLTSHYDQAVRWAKRKASLGSSLAIVNEYDLSEDLGDAKVLRFQADAAWVDFVCDCRRGGKAYEQYDLIIGGVADDKVFYAIDMYLQGLWGIETTLEALRFYDVNDQWCFVSQRLLDERLTFVEGKEIAL